ncbi:chymotrypsin-like elastase family member 2A isoform X2 [Drosophila teissieri]|uniref:chymotrypsin-like elastase family member 2A isoform X2 n=1 Tax=Drosophila teissieri TaxID=7243 RepID=UPI001CBA49E0|nr:chymotrypsin-like elastase family member 2A isoform X2 [Drosophila teissieri]
MSCSSSHLPIFLGFVLTAAHCIVSSKMIVRLGEYDVRNPRPDCGGGVCVPRAYTVELDMKFVHSGYRSIFKYDIGLLRMKTAVQYSDYVRPICFLVNGHLENRTEFNITGWGLTDNGQPSQTLQTATVFNVDLDYCSKKFTGGTVDESHICASNSKGDACHGDSGGPLSAQIVRDGSSLTFQYGIISYGSEKCNSHGVYTNVTHYREWILSTIEAASLLEENCGTVARSRRVRRLVGGHDAGGLSHPWMVMVPIDYRSFCGGSLITSRFVLTSASCVYSWMIMKVFLGGHDMDLPQTFLEVQIDRKILHPQFGLQNPFKHNIALLRMKQEVPFSDRIRPICLSINQPLARLQKYTLTGWGDTGDGRESRILQENTLFGVDPSLCNSTFYGQVDRSHICTTGMNGNMCNKDGGGPLSAQLPYKGTNRTFLLGVISFGELTCRGYGLSTNVAHYLDWIKNMIEENSITFI